jgi:uncharacterized iron-regulated protein
MSTPPGGRWRSTLRLDHPLVGVIWSVAENRSIGGERFAMEMVGARYRLLGEVHDNPDHHQIQLDLLRALAEAGRKPTVAFEQFDTEHDVALQERLASGKASADAIASAVNFSKSGWEWNFYRPLVELALRHGMPLRAANLSRAAAQRTIREGLKTLGADRIAALKLETVWSAQREQVLREVIFDGHCRALPERALPAMALAQRVRDATLAEALLDAGADGAVLIAGNGHVRRDLAVPLYVRANVPNAAIRALGILEVEEGKTDPRSYVETLATLPPAYDFVFFTPETSRPDPCAAFKPG